MFVQNHLILVSVLEAARFGFCLVFFFNMESIFFSSSSIDYLRVHNRARLSILLSNHVPCRCDTKHNKAHQVTAFQCLCS